MGENVDRTASRVSYPKQLIFALLIVVVSCAVPLRHILGLGKPKSLDELGISFNYALLTLDYFNSGFIRRGLGGTIMHLIDWRDTAEAGLSFQLFSAVWLAIPLTLIAFRFHAHFPRRGLFLAAVLLLSPQLLRAYSPDLARTDMLACGFIAWALIGFQAGRPLVAAVVLAIGLLAHETSIIFGVPLLAALALSERPPRAQLRRLGVAFAVFAALVVLIVVVQHLARPAPEHLLATMTARTTPTLLRDWSMFMIIENAGSIAASNCQSWSNAVFPFDLLAGFAVLACYFPVLLFRRRHAAAFVLASVVPMAAISALAIDYGRWLSFAVMNAWLLRASRVDEADEKVSPRRWVAAGGIGLLLLAGGITTTFWPNKAVQSAAERIWARPRLSVEQSADLCRPGWRERISTDLPGAFAADVSPDKQARRSRPFPRAERPVPRS